MKKTVILKILITFLLLSAIACILFGKNVIKVPGFTVSNAYIEALFRTSKTSFRMTATVYVWVLMVTSIASIILTWMKQSRSSLIACFVCLVSPVCHAIVCIINGYGPFHVDCTCDFFMFVLPVAAAVLSFILFRFNKQESGS